jgi:hypothetical protein
MLAESITTIRENAKILLATTGMARQKIERRQRLGDDETESGAAREQAGCAIGRAAECDPRWRLVVVEAATAFH